MHKRFLDTLFADKDTDRGYVLTWFFDRGHIKESHWSRTAAEAADLVERAKARRLDAYVGVGLAPKPYGLTQRCPADEIIGIPGLWLDIDLKSVEHQKENLPETTAEAMKLVYSLPMGFDPTIVVNSGHGIQAWWLFRETWYFDNDDERREAALLEKRFIYHFKNKAAENGWSVDSVQDLARVMRIPGTTNYKGNPVPVEIIEECDKRYNPIDFDEWLPVTSLDDTIFDPNGEAAFVINPEATPPFDKFQDLSELEPKFEASCNHQRKDLADQSISSYDMSIARYACMAGWSDQEVVDLICWTWRKNDVRTKYRIDYFQRTLHVAKRDLDKKKSSETIAIHVDMQNVDDDRARLDITKQQELLASLSSVFGVRLTQIIKYMTDPPLYKLQTVRGEITLGDVTDLIKQDKFRSKVAAATGKLLPKFSSEDWDCSAQTLLDCCVEIDVGDEATEDGQTISWLQLYLISRGKPFSEENKIEAIEQRLPFEYKNGIAFFGDDLIRWVKTTQQERVTAKQMGVRLREIGAETTRLHPSRNTMVSVYTITQDALRGKG